MIFGQILPSASRMIAALTVLTISLSARAEVSFQESRTWTRARSIHAGQQIWGFQSSYQKASERYSGSGQTQPLGRPYTRAVTWRQLIEETAAAEKSEVESYMHARGAAQDDVAAEASYNVDRENVGFQFDWTYGLTKRWAIGFSVPVIYQKTSVSSKVTMFGGPSGQRKADLTQKIRTISEQELANSGYDTIPDQSTSWNWGDVTLLSQISVWESYRWQWALQPLVRFPTARNQDLDDYIRSTDDSGQMDTGMNTLIDWRQRKWTLGFQGGYIVQLPDSQRQRVSDASSTRRVDPKVARDLGDWYWGGLSADYHLGLRTELNIEYSYLRKFMDRYKGSSSDGMEYSRFENGTDQEVHQTRVGAQYILSSNGIRGGIEEKWVAGVGYSYPWIGRNSLSAGRASIDLLTYF